MKIKLGLDTLKELDMGKIPAAFNHELAYVVKDCLDRPGDDAVRAVELRLEVTPDCDASGVAETVTAEFSVKSKIPPRRTKKFQLQASANGTVIVNPESADDVNQGTLDELDQEEPRKGGRRK